MSGAEQLCGLRSIGYNGSTAYRGRIAGTHCAGGKIAFHLLAFGKLEPVVSAESISNRVGVQCHYYLSGFTDIELWSHGGVASNMQVLRNETKRSYHCRNGRRRCNSFGRWQGILRNLPRG